MSFESVGRADVEFRANTGEFRRDMGVIREQYARTTGAMSEDSLRAAIAQEKLDRAISRSGPNSLRAKEQTLAYRRELEALSRDAGRAGRAIQQEERRASHGSGGSLRQSGAGRFGRGVLAGGLGGHLSRLAYFGGSAALGGVGAAFLVKQAVSAATTIQEETEKTGVVFGRSASQVQHWAGTLAQSFGVGEGEALKFAGIFGNMLRPMGFAEDKAAQMSERLVTLAADMASFNNVSPERALQALQSGLAGQVRPLRTLGVFLSQARIEEEAYSSGIAKQGAKLTEAQKAQARYNIILKDTKLQQGDVARNTGSLSVATSKFRAGLEDAEATIARAALPALVRYTNQGGRYLENLNKTGRLQRDVNSVMHTTGQAVHGVVDAFRIVRSVVVPLNNALGGTRRTVRLLGVAFVALKLNALLRDLGLVRGGILGIGRAAVISTGEVDGLAAAEGRAGAGGGAGGAARATRRSKVGRIAGNVARSIGPQLLAVDAALFLNDELSHHTKGHTASGAEVFEQDGKYYIRTANGRAVITKQLSAVQAARELGYSGPASATPAVRRGFDAPLRQFAPSNPPKRGPHILPPLKEFKLTGALIAEEHAAAATVSDRDDVANAAHVRDYILGLIKSGRLKPGTQAFFDAEDALGGARGQIASAQTDVGKTRAKQHDDQVRKRRDQRQAQIKRLTEAPVALRIAEQTARAHHAGEAKIVAILRQEKKAIDEQIVELRKIHAGKEAILRARSNEAAVQRRIDAAGKKKPASTTTSGQLEKEFLESLSQVIGEYAPNVLGGSGPGASAVVVHQHFPHPPTQDGNREAAYARHAMAAAFYG